MCISIRRLGICAGALLALCAVTSRSFGDVDLEVPNGVKVTGTLQPADEAVSAIITSKRQPTAFLVLPNQVNPVRP